jgi:hypothetical protein
MSLRTFDGFQVVFSEKLLEMKALDQDSQKYHAMEQQLGQYCYQAEEQLPQAELRLLKGVLEISGGTWQSYKATFIAGGSSRG